MAGQHGRARPKSKETDPARGRDRGVFRTPIHSLTDQQGCPLPLRGTGDQRHDRTRDRVLVAAWTDAPLPCLSAAWAYDGDAFRAQWTRQGIEAIIPARARRTHPRSHDPARYRPWNTASAGSHTG